MVRQIIYIIYVKREREKERERKREGERERGERREEINDKQRAKYKQLGTVG
jgi:hypothetical protein